MAENFKVLWGSVGGNSGNHAQGSVVADWYLEQSGHDVARLLELGAIEKTDLPCDAAILTPKPGLSSAAPEESLVRDNNRLRSEVKAFAEANFLLQKKVEEAERKSGAAVKDHDGKLGEIARLMQLAADRGTELEACKAELAAADRENAELRKELAAANELLTQPV